MNNFNARRRAIFFAAENTRDPGKYDFLSRFNSSGNFEAPESGWFRIELYGASGNGGECGSKKESHWVFDKTTGEQYEEYTYYNTGGGGGGGGGCAISHLRLKKGDKISIAVGETGKDSTVSISSFYESYPSMKVSAAGNGGRGNSSGAGYGGAGGIALGGNIENHDGKAGEKGGVAETGKTLSQAAGGFSGYSGGNIGGKGAGAAKSGDIKAESGSAGFAIIYRGINN